jgi:hypothetical protein
MRSRNLYGATGQGKLTAPVSEVCKFLYAFERAPWMWNLFLQTQNNKYTEKARTSVFRQGFQPTICYCGRSQYIPETSLPLWSALHALTVPHGPLPPSFPFQNKITIKQLQMVPHSRKHHKVSFNRLSIFNQGGNSRKHWDKYSRNQCYDVREMYHTEMQYCRENFKVNTRF